MVYMGQAIIANNDKNEILGHYNVCVNYQNFR